MYSSVPERGGDSVDSNRMSSNGGFTFVDGARRRPNTNPFMDPSGLLPLLGHSYRACRLNDATVTVSLPKRQTNVRLILTHPRVPPPTFFIVMKNIMPDWSNDVALKFLEIYKVESILWNPKHTQHKDKVAMNAAWNRIAKIMEMPVPEVKRKKDSLMASFRHHFRRKKKSITGGGRAKKIYTPSWFAYEVMEEFLSAVYKCNDEESTQHMEADDLIESGEDGITNDRQATPPAHVPKSKRVQSRLIRSTHPPEQVPRESELPESSNQMEQTLSSINSILTQKQSREDDECDLYGKLIAKKLRKISEKERQEIMYDIDGLLINRTRRSNVNKPTSSQSSRNS